MLRQQTVDETLAVPLDTLVDCQMTFMHSYGRCEQLPPDPRDAPDPATYGPCVYQLSLQLGWYRTRTSVIIEYVIIHDFMLIRTLPALRAPDSDRHHFFSDLHPGIQNSHCSDTDHRVGHDQLPNREATADTRQTSRATGKSRQLPRGTEAGSIQFCAVL